MTDQALCVLTEDPGALCRAKNLEGLFLVVFSYPMLLQPGQRLLNLF